MGLLIDASVFIARERGQLDLGSQGIGRPREPLLVSVITASELLHGVHRAQNPLQAKRRATFVEAILDRFPTLGLGVLTANERDFRRIPELEVHPVKPV